MTRNFSLSNLKKKIVLILSVIMVICVACFCLTACNDETEHITVTDPSYSKTETTTEISNPNFYTGTANCDLTTIPIASPTGWTISTDNSATSSTVSSGVIVTSDDGWTNLLSNLYKDSDFINYIKNLFDFTDNDVVEGIRSEQSDDNYNPTDSEKKEYITKTYLSQLVNPKTHADATDNAVFMLNNIASSTNFGLGTAQKVTSSSSVSLEKGATYAISVWVKTANISDAERLNGYGANIRLKNTFNSSTQAYYKVSNIIADDWTKYTIYVKADSDYTCTVTLILGLGYGNGSSTSIKDYVEGTAYFDDITVEKLDNEPNMVSDKMVYGSEDDIEATVTNNTCFYDMSFAYSVGEFFNQSIELPTTGEFTKSNTTIGNEAITSKTYNSNSTAEVITTSGVTEVKVNQASYTLNLNNSNFTLANGEYALISFYYKNQLNKLGSTEFTIDVIDKQDTIVRTSKAVTTLTIVSDEYSRCIILVKNAWETGDDRSFEINFIVGPANVKAVEYSSDFATGSLFIKDICLAKGTIDDEESEYYDIYTMFKNNANATISLYAGYESEYIENEDTTTYNIKTAYGNIGDILNNPTNPEDYEGVVANHIYIKDKVDGEADNREIITNTRSGNGNSNGVAGVINSKYLNNYTDGLTIKTALGEIEEDDVVQALMINNKVDDCYGFISGNSTIGASAYGKVTVTLRVYDNATAFVYLVNTATASKKVLTFNSFTVNNDVVNGIANGTAVDGNALTYELKVTSDMMDEDGWLTVSFYIATGNTDKSFRVEVWNGSRDESIKSTGYVFIKDVEVTTTEAFSEPSKWNNAFSTDGNPLYENTQANFTTLYAYQRELTDTEKSFNKEYSDQAVSYEVNYIWAKGASVVYGVFNTVDPVEVNPYDSIEDEEEESCASCEKAENDPASFWLGFSSILLGVVILLALIALIVKNIRAKRIANANDAKSHFKVTSRIKKETKKTKEEKVEEVSEVKEETVENTENVQETNEEVTEQTVEEEKSDDYVYGEVQSFGSVNEEAPVENTDAPAENTETAEVKEETTEKTTEEQKDE